MKNSRQLLVELMLFYFMVLLVRIIGPRKVSSSFTGNDVVMALPTKTVKDEIIVISRQIRYDYHYTRWLYSKTLFLYRVDLFHLKDGAIMNSTNGHYPETMCWRWLTIQAHHCAIQAHLDIAHLDIFEFNGS